MKKRSAIITGSSSGFGLLTAIELAKKDFSVIATMRNTSKAEILLELSKQNGVRENIDIRQLDVTSEESVNNFILKIESADILVNNAGLAVGGFCEELSLKDYRVQFETNFFGAIRVTQALLPFLRKSDQGKIINISSISGQIGFPGLSAYSASKHALEGWSESLRLELKPFGIDVVLVEPGSYETSIWTSIDDVNTKADSIYKDYMKFILNELEKGKPDYGNPIEVARLVSDIADHKNPALRYPVGKGVKRNLILKNILPWKTIEKAVLKRIAKK
ncbi:SDR family oxidoreductase [Neobacillus terrae]|uniref:SDR family oxidoreductase n=1 Tax=Neobacillus terrae TaxID=3034837 RepID=UPI001408ABC9|nr:SDR family oxidoreductase [Neobacillus terrae]NHM31213.1 SDR family oxidoreductase [Neobacillus terrae]